MSTSPVARILVHVLALLVLTHAATLVAIPPTDDNVWYAWVVGPWEGIGNLLPVAVALQLIAAVVIVLRFPGDRRPLRVGLLIASSVVATVINSIVIGIVATVTTSTEMDVHPFALSLFVTGLAGMVFVIAASLAAALSEYALLPTPRSTVAT